MINSRDLLKKTGLGSAKTLTRWYQQGLIPPPEILTHPNGRGKMAYWPDWVLTKCEQIVALRKKGYAPRAAVMQLEVERAEAIVKEIKARPSIQEMLAATKVNLKRGGETNLFLVFLAMILKRARPLLISADLERKLAEQIRERRVIDTAIDYIGSGYDPVLLFDGENVTVAADFMVSHRLSSEMNEGRPYLVVPLFESLRSAFEKIGHSAAGKPCVFPSTMVRVMEGKELVEYEFCPGGTLGFELLRETAKIIGQVRESKEEQQ